MNKGEWSEFYVLLKLLAEGELTTANSELQPIAGEFLKIKTILRQTLQNNLLNYDILPALGIVKFRLPDGAEQTVPQATLATMAQQLLHAIRSSQKSQEVARLAHPILTQLGDPKIKEKSASKRDINVVAVDTRAGQQEVALGFSIKSRLGGAPSLFNASKDHTNFLYQVEIDYDEGFKIFEQKCKAQTLLKILRAKNISLKFLQPCGDVLRDNLQMIDANQAMILAACLEFYYMGLGPKIADILTYLVARDPCAYGVRAAQLYTYKLKEFLAAVALGMTPASPWAGNTDANGGYIIVKEDGSLVGYHVYNMDKFKDYLFHHTFFDTPSTSRHGHGTLFDQGGQWYLKLNLQIRFF